MEAVAHRVIIKPEEQTTIGTIIIPDTAKKEEPTRGTVIAAGINKYGIEKGQKVVFNRWKGDKITVRGDELVSIIDRDVIAIML